VRGSVGADCFVGLEADFNETIAQSLRGICKLGLVDGRVTLKTCELAEKLDLACILGTKSLRRPIQGWTHDSWTVQHCDRGGVTTRLTTGCCLIPGVNFPKLECLEGSVPRDASTVLDARAPARKYRAAPLNCVVMPLGCENLGSDGKPYFHGGGLLPGDLDRRTEVLTPGVYARKGDWALRRLTLEEVLVAKDYGKVLTDLLSVGTLSNALLRNLTPGKTLVALAERWGCNNGGGGAPFFRFGKKGRPGGEITDQEPPIKKSKFQIAERSPQCSRRIRTIGNVTRVSFLKDKKALEGDHLEFIRDKRVLTPRDREPVLVETVGVSFDTGSDEKGMKGDHSDFLRDKRVFTLGTREMVLVETVGNSDEVDGKATDECETDARPKPDTMLDDIARKNQNRKAVKSDDAAVPEYLWEDNLLEGIKDQAWDDTKLVKVRRVATWLRSKMLRWWKRQVTTSYIAWAKVKYSLADVEEKVEWIERDASCKFSWSKASYSWFKEGKGDYRAWWKRRFLVTHQDKEPARDAIWRAAETSWWGWDLGSRPFHWRWPSFYQEVIRDGLKVHFQDTPPKYRKSQRDMSDEAMKLQVIKKLLKARERGYIAPGMVESLTAFFAVPKGEDDIRLVYDGSVSGLNLSIWVPRFFLPTLRTHLRAVDEDTYMADVDIGEMFLNFILHRELRTLAGVDLTHYFPKDAKDTPDGRGVKVWETWQRAAMGLRSSPYQAVQAMGVAEEVIRGDRKDPSNVFRWDEVVLNLPGDEDYDPSMPWVYKVRCNDGRIAADLFIFVDDLRPTGPSRKDAWLAARQAASKLNFLGIQDAPRKRRASSRSPGAWAGGVVRTLDDGVFILSSQEKWDKAKVLLEEVQQMLNEDPTKLSRKRLEQIRGFLQYVIQTYSSFTSYLIGFHMTIDSWRPGRDHEGWRIAQSLWQEMKKEDEEWSREEVRSEEAPAYVAAVPRLQGDVTALLRLMKAVHPPLKRVRCKKTAKAFYGFGDASGSGFGATLQIGEHIHYEYGQWCSEVTETRSSNWRELNNLVEAIERSVEEHDMRGSEFFIFTDNSTAEAAFWKGTSKSPLLFELVLRLKELEIEKDIQIHVVHVSGKRMIAEGSDGLSRADHGEGVMLGKDIRTFIPLHLDPVVREPKVGDWISDVTRGLDFQHLQPSGWFDDAHSDGNFVWTVPPAAGEVVVEQLGFIRLKRPSSMHLIIIPRLMTGRWRRHLSRGTDGYSRLEDKEVWNLTRHYEPLLIFLCLPFRSADPKLQERSRLVDRFKRAMYDQRVPEIPSARRRDILCQLFCDARRLCPL
jgi:hypothetical protein